MLVSKDKGKTWKAHGSITLPNTWLIEQTVVELTSKATNYDGGGGDGDDHDNYNNNNSVNRLQCPV